MAMHSVAATQASRLQARSRLLLAMLFTILAARDAIAAPSVSLRRAADRPIVAYQRVEFEIALDKTYDNPFNPDEIAVDAEITSPDGRTIRLPAFWDRDGERGGAFR